MKSYYNLIMSNDEFIPILSKSLYYDNIPVDSDENVLKHFNKYKSIGDYIVDDPWAKRVYKSGNSLEYKLLIETILVLETRFYEVEEPNNNNNYLSGDEEDYEFDLNNIGC